MSVRRDQIRQRVRRRENPWATLVFGLAVLACGVIFWLDHLGRLEASTYLRWWPVAALAFGIAHFPQRQWLGGAIWTAVGVVFLLPLLGYPGLNVFRIVGVWPLLYSAVGLALVMQALRSRGGEGGFHALAVMAGNVRRLGSQEFAGGDAIAVMGGCTVDLSASRLTREASIDVLAFWGGIEVHVPRGWRIAVRATTILGGVLDMTEGAANDAPQLVIRGSIIMGGVEVKHAPESRP